MSAQKLQKVQNRALRAVLSVDWAFPTESIYDQLKLDTLEERRVKHVMHFMHKIAHQLLPPSICCYFEFKDYTYYFRHKLFYINLPRVQTDYKKRSLSYRGAKSWNNLTNELKSLDLIQFKKRLNTQVVGISVQ